MKALAKFASAAALVLATSTAANATYYPEDPCPPETPTVPTTPTTPSTPVNNTNTNNANANANASANSRSNSSATANNNNNVNVRNTVNAAGGQGGQGGQGGAGGSAAATAAGGAGGNSSATGGSSTSSANNGGLSNTNVTNYNAPKQVGNAPAVFLNPAGDCGEGFSLSVGFIGGAVGGGATSQNRVCLSQKAAMAIMNAGIVLKDDGMIVGSMETLASIHPEIKTGLEKAGVAFSTSCYSAVVARSRVLAVGLTQEKCDTVFVSFKAAAAPVVVQSEAPKAVAVETKPAGPVIPDCGTKPVVFDKATKTLVCGNDLN